MKNNNWKNNWRKGLSVVKKFFVDEFIWLRSYIYSSMRFIRGFPGALSILVRNTVLYTFFNAYVDEPVRLFLNKCWDLVENYSFWRRLYYSVSFFSSDLFQYFFRVFLFIFFILWLIWEAIFLRTYFLGTPHDVKLTIDRKELSPGWTRYAPLFMVESLYFLMRPALRVFNTLNVVRSNLYGALILFYYLLIHPFFSFVRDSVVYVIRSIKKFFTYIFKFGYFFADKFFIFDFFRLIYNIFFFIYKWLFIVFGLFKFFFLSVINFFNLLLKLPFFFVFGVLRGIIHFFFVSYFFFRTFSLVEFRNFHSIMLDYKSHIIYSSSSYRFYTFVWRILFIFYIFAEYFRIKLQENSNFYWFKLNIKISNFFSFGFFKFLVFFFKLMYFLFMYLMIIYFFFIFFL